MRLQGEYGPSPVGWVREQADAYEASNGQQAATLRDTGIPVIVVTMRGRSSGKLRKVPLMKVEHDGSYALIGSRGGAPTDPLWVANLDANPSEVTVQDGPEPFAVNVRRAEGAERAEWWERSVAAFPNYAEYQAKTDRLIPVFIASPAASA